MAIDLSAQVVVIRIGISRYKAPTAAQKKLGRQQFESLPAVNRDMERLADLFTSPAYDDLYFAVQPVISGTAGHVIDELTAVAEEIAEVPDRTVILIWGGHGAAVGNDLALATRESAKPMYPGDGLPPTIIVDKLVASRGKALYLMLDVCQAAAGAGDVAATAAKRFQDAQAGRMGLAALFSAQNYELAAEGLFAETLERVLKSGPSSAAIAELEQEKLSNISEKDRFLTANDLEDILLAEFDHLRKTRPRIQTPVGERIGRNFAVFPNPIFKKDSDPVLVDEARARWIRQGDVETHFLPKARGLEPGEEGWFFSGRHNVSREIVNWLDRKGSLDQNLYVLTGEGGTGKSAVIGRIVALSDDELRKRAAAMGWNEKADLRAGILPKLGSFDAALHLRGLNAEGTAAAFEELLELKTNPNYMGTPSDLGSFVAQVPVSLPGSQRPISIVLDALDEADDPGRIAELLIRPLARKGWRILVASRRSAAHRGAPDLLGQVGPAHLKDLTRERNTHGDIAGYVKGRLLSDGSPYLGNHAAIESIASAVASRSNNKFLYARIVTSSLLHGEPIDASDLGNLATSVADAFSHDLSEFDRSFQEKFGRTDPGATALFEALAWGEGSGLPLRDNIWSIVATAIADPEVPYEPEHTQWALREAGRYIIESGDGEQAVYRLYHESLNDLLRARRPAAPTRQQIAQALLDTTRGDAGWALANVYVVRNIITHLQDQPRTIERVCTDPRFLRHALQLEGVDGLVSLLLTAQRSSSSASVEAIARTIRRARVALSRDPEQLASQLQARLGDEAEPAIEALVHGLASIAPRVWLLNRGASLPWRADLETIQTYPAKVRCLSFGELDGNSVIAVGSGEIVYIWDPRRGGMGTPISNEGLRVTSVALGTLDGRSAVAVSAGYNGVLDIRDPHTGISLFPRLQMGVGKSLALGSLGAFDAVALEGSDSLVVLELGSQEPAYSSEFALTPGRWRGELVALRKRGAEYEFFSLRTGRTKGPPVPTSDKPLALGDWNGEPILASLNRDEPGRLTFWNLENGRQLDKEVNLNFRPRAVAFGEVNGEPVVAAANETDSEVGFVALRQPVSTRKSERSRQIVSSARSVLGVGRLDGHLVAFLDNAKVFNPISGELTDLAEVQGRLEILVGVDIAPMMPPSPPMRRSFGVQVLRSDRPLDWPATCQAFVHSENRLCIARGSHGGVVWLIQVDNQQVVHGPYTDLGPTYDFYYGKGADDRDVIDIALGNTPQGALLAIACTGRVQLFDAMTEARLPAPDTGDSQIVAVALGTVAAKSVLVAGSSGGAVSLWDTTTLRRLAGFTFDVGVQGVWLAAGSLIVRTDDFRFRVFDVVIEP